MKTSQAGLDLIKSFEGCRLEAYKPVATEKYYTIGYGHYGADVKKGMKITQAQAEAYLKADLEKFENSVNAYSLPWINQNRFDALVSFTYNCGAGNLKSLLNSGKRTASQVSASLLAYNKAGGKVLAGLTRRRTAEKALFDKAVATSKKPAVALPTVKSGDRTAQAKALQADLNYYGASLTVDGIFGAKSVEALKKWQKANGLVADGIYGSNSYVKMKELS